MQWLRLHQNLSIVTVLEDDCAPLGVKKYLATPSLGRVAHISKNLTVMSRSKWRSPSQIQSFSGVWDHLDLYTARDITDFAE